MDLPHGPAQPWPWAARAARTTLVLCCGCHRRAHRLLTLFVHAGVEPAPSVLKQVRPIEVELARYSWANADHSGPGHLPYTISDGTPPP